MLKLMNTDFFNGLFLFYLLFKKGSWVNEKAK